MGGHDGLPRPTMGYLHFRRRNADTCCWRGHNVSPITWVEMGGRDGLPRPTMGYLRFRRRNTDACTHTCVYFYIFETCGCGRWWEEGS